MQFPRGNEVPFTSGISGIVFLVAWYKVGTTQMIPAESIIFGAWALIYLTEWALRTTGVVSGTPRAAPRRAPRPAGQYPAATDGEGT